MSEEPNVTKTVRVVEVVKCSRCWRSAELRSDEAREWLWVERGDGRADPMCLDCIEPSEREEHRAAVARMQAVERLH